MIRKSVFKIEVYTIIVRLKSINLSVVMIKLSVVIITYNEERLIAQCLNSVKTIADEIVIVDSYSSDNTKNICLAHDVKFIEHPFEGHIQQKNYAISQAGHPYILSLDADEALDATAQKAIATVKENWDADGYYFNRLNNYCGKWIRHSGWYPDRKLRLWDSRKGKWKGQNPHDRYEMVDGATTRVLDGDILHFTIDSIHNHIKQINYFTDISSKELYRKGKRATILHILFSPPVKFFRDFFLKRGFMDGIHGFLIAVNSAYAKFLKYTKLYMLQRKGQ